MNLVIGLLILLFAIAVIEIGDFKLVPFLLGILGITLISQFILEGAGFEIVPLAIFSILFVPAILLFFTLKTKRTEERPIILGLPSLGLLIVLVAVTYGISAFVFSMEGIQWQLVLIGAYGLLIKTDLRKSVASLSIIINSLHLFGVSFDVFMEIALTSLSAVLLLILILFAMKIYSVKGSMSTRDLKELRF
ncbi:MAG: hypothetical protein ACFFDP_04755 [Promethearchaeota archaeon]